MAEIKDKSLLDVNGKLSAKRKWAARYLMVGLAWPLLHYTIGVIFVLMKKEFNVEFPIDIWYGLIGGGFAMLGITIFESKVN